VGWTTFLPILVSLGRYVLGLIGQHLSDASRDLATLTLEVTALVMMQVFVLHLYAKFEIRRPSRSVNIGHLLCKH